jgi:hypothetical protein
MKDVISKLFLRSKLFPSLFKNMHFDTAELANPVLVRYSLCFERAVTEILLKRQLSGVTDHMRESQLGHLSAGGRSR